MIDTMSLLNHLSIAGHVILFQVSHKSCMHKITIEDELELVMPVKLPHFPVSSSMQLDDLPTQKNPVKK